MPSRTGLSDRIRADLLLVARGLFESRSQARAAIEAGLVTAGGAVVTRASDLLSPASGMTARPAHPWVSRGGVKLAAALDAFAIDPAGFVCLDVGASTGGFTDVLLAGGAGRVHAVDVGRGQLHPKIAADSRVLSLEATDARRLAGLIEPRSIDLVTVDVSFVSLRLVLPELIFCLKNRGQLVALVKPQFEVGRAGVGRGGIVRDDDLRRESVAGISGLLVSLGLELLGSLPSPIAGRGGNVEFLIGGRLG